MTRLVSYMTNRVGICALLFIFSIQGLLIIKIDNIYADWFEDGLERCFIVMHNGTRFELTTLDEKGIHGTVGQIEDILEENGYLWKDIMIVIHNHFFRPRFSERDLKTYHNMRGRGFDGVFAIYITSSGRVRTMRSEKK